MRMRQILLVLSLTAAAAMPSTAAGILDYHFNPQTVVGNAGDTIFLNGSLQNIGDADLFLNDFLVQFTAPGDLYFSADQNFFFANVAGRFVASDPAYVGPIFEIIIGADAPVGTYHGDATIYGGVDEFASSIVGLQPFTIVVAPEPGTSLTMFIGALCLTGITLKRRMYSRAH